MDDYAEKEAYAQQQACDAVPTPPYGSLGGGVVQDTEWPMRHAFEILQQAHRLRRDDKLMADLRVWLRKQRDDLGNLLDEMGV